MSCASIPPVAAACATASCSSAIPAKIKFVAEDPAVFIEEARNCTDVQLREKLRNAYPPRNFIEREQAYRLETHYFDELEKGTFQILSCKAEGMSLSFHLVQNSDGIAALYLHFSPGDENVVTWLRDQMGQTMDPSSVALGRRKIDGAKNISHFITTLDNDHVLPWNRDERENVQCALGIQEQIDHDRSQKMKEMRAALSEIRNQIQRLEASKQTTAREIWGTFEKMRREIVLAEPKIGLPMEGLMRQLGPLELGPSVVSEFNGAAASAAGPSVLRRRPAELQPWQMTEEQALDAAMRASLESIRPPPLPEAAAAAAGHR